MRFSFILASLTAAACAAPAWHQGPVMADDDNLMERRDVVRVQVVQAHTSRFTNIMITKITRYAADAASDVQGFLSESFRGAVADGSGEVMTIAYGKKASPFVVGSGIGSGRGKGKGSAAMAVIGTGFRYWALGIGWLCLFWPFPWFWLLRAHISDGCILRRCKNQ